MTRVSVEDVPDRLAHSIPETARLLDVSPSTVNRMIRRGALRTVKIGSDRRVPRSELYRLLETPDTPQEATG